MSGKTEQFFCRRKYLLAAVLFLLLLVGAGVLYFLYPAAKDFFPKCPFYESLHLYCPGCGSTRATFYLLHGDLQGVFRSNLIYLPTILFVVFLLIRPKYLPRPWVVWGLFGMICLFWILRNLPWYPFTLLAPAPVSF